MKPSPLQLEHYVLAESHCQASPEPPGDNYEPWGAADADHFETSVRVGRGEEDPNFYQIHLSVNTIEEAGPKLPYAISIHIIGYFRVDPEFEHDHLEHLVRINGASVLYSAARDFVLTLTSRGPWGQLMLPTINFRINSQAKQESQVAEEGRE